MQRFVVYCSWELIQSWSGRAGIRCLSLVGAHYIGPRPAPRSRSRGTGNRSVEAKSRLPTRPGTTGTAGQNNHGYALAVIWSNDTSCLSTAAEKPALTTVTCWALAALHKAVQCQFSVNWYQLVSDNSVSSWLSLPSDKSHLVIWFFKKNGFSAIGGADLGQELTTNSLPVRQKCSWICLIISFSSRCINPQALICTVRWNQSNSAQGTVAGCHLSEELKCPVLMSTLSSSGSLRLVASQHAAHIKTHKRTGSPTSRHRTELRKAPEAAIFFFVCDHSRALQVSCLAGKEGSGKSQTQTALSSAQQQHKQDSSYPVQCIGSLSKQQTN